MEYARWYFNRLTPTFPWTVSESGEFLLPKLVLMVLTAFGILLIKSMTLYDQTNTTSMDLSYKRGNIPPRGIFTGKPVPSFLQY